MMMSSLAGLLPEEMVDQDEAGHGFYNGNGPWNDTWVMPTGSGKLNGLTGHIDGLLFFADGSDRFESSPKFNGHPIADASLNAATVIGCRPHSSLGFLERIIVF